MANLLGRRMREREIYDIYIYILVRGRALCLAADASLWARRGFWTDSAVDTPGDNIGYMIHVWISGAFQTHVIPVASLAFWAGVCHFYGRCLACVQGQEGLQSQKQANHCPIDLTFDLNFLPGREVHQVRCS